MFLRRRSGVQCAGYRVRHGSISWSFLRPVAAFALLAIGAAPARAVDAGQPVPGIAVVNPYQEQTREVAESAGRIADSIPEVEGLRGQAERLGDASRIACIDEKLGRIRSSRDASDVIRRSWPTARSDHAFASRTVDRMRLLKLYAISAVDEAHRCSDAKIRTETVVSIQRGIPEIGRLGDPVRPPIFERPPLASPY